MAERRPDPLDFIGRHRHSSACTTHQDGPVDPCLHDGPRSHVGYVGIVNRMAAICSKIDTLVAQLPERGDDPLFGSKAMMVTSKADSHSFLQTISMGPLMLGALYHHPDKRGVRCIPGIERITSRVLIQRCRVHKKRNIQKYLPKRYHGVLSLKLKMAWGMTEYDKAMKELRKVHDWLASINQEAAASLDEGMEETLTINRLSLPPQLRASSPARI